MTSIRSRLAIGLTMVMALLLLGQWLWLTLTIDRLIEKQVITRLQEETESLLANLNIDQTGRLQLDSQRLSSSYQRAFSGLYFSVYSKQQSVLSRSLWDFNLTVPQLSAGEQAILYLNGPQDQPLLAMSAGYIKQTRPLTITVAEDISWMLADKRHFQMFFTLLSALGLVLLLLLQALIVRRALQPLTKAKMQLKQLEKGDIEQIDEQVPDEIKPLLSELNRLMGSMVNKTRRSRQTLGNLAHRLKTQLTLLNQVADAELISTDPATRKAIYQQTEHIRQIIDRELKRARLSGFTLPGKGVDLGALISQLVDTLYLIHQDKNFAINWQLEDNVRFNGDREDVLELLGNLMDNACKWCNKAVRLQVRMQAGLVFIVEDDGPGCDIDDLSALTRRGFRTDESKPGSGLGLAIAFDIVDSYEGTMQFDRSEQLGGLQVTVHLQSPLAN
ncbi:sensor histidine kinase [Methylophaga sp. OBS4]|uniref:sensor histidine kinase n=1 Tax=Methylophaga sp. OBS4 TaxID=2991935 RepID=UPI002255E27F|nr:sensor histidine kinase [Methylophaga sp. OBS4]MCX4188107.1 sensor histidine kinase [Methylophaga sp. OBS4]